ncbi:MAG: DUF2088 domain-containing protein [Planctomycetes bacterium]|nr:DUF2088 domain-containing protein [Planctomycetota bacterium]
MPIRWVEVGPGAGPSRCAGEDPVAHAIAYASEIRPIIARAHAGGPPPLILINDPDRATATAPALDAIDRLRREIHGPRADLPWPVLVATGTHVWDDPAVRARHEEASLRGRLEAAVWHDAGGRLATIGGFRFHPLVAEASSLIAIGSCEPHYFAGITGPHKTIAIGTLGRDDIEANHRHALSSEAEGLRLAGNPIHDGVVAILEALRAAGKDLVGIAEVMRGDEAVACAVGDVEAAIESVRPAVEAIYLARVPRPADIVLARVGGPLGRTFYQADKAIKNVEACVRRGGAIILSADLAGGIGPDRSVRLLAETRDLAGALARVEKGYVLGDHKAVRLRRLMDPRARDVRVMLASPHLDPRALDRTGIDVVRSERDAIARVEAMLAGRGADPQGLIVEDAGNVTVRLAGGESAREGSA